MKITDEYIEELFEGTNFGEKINSSTDEKRELIKKTLKNQALGFWAGHTIYSIIKSGGFIIDGKKSGTKDLTFLGHMLLDE